MISDPQDAAAAGICWLARWSAHPFAPIAENARTRHPRPCRWCVVDPELLIEWLQDFNERDSADFISSRFRALPPDAQRRLVDRSLYSEGTPA